MKEHAIAGEQFRLQLDQRAAAHAEELALSRQATQDAEIRVRELDTQVGLWREQVSALSNRARDEARTAAERLDDLNTRHAVEVERMRQEVREWEQALAAEQASACQQFETQIQQRDATHAEELALSRQATESAEIRVRELATQVGLWREQTSALTSRVRDQAQAAAERLDDLRAQHAVEVERMRQEVRQWKQATTAEHASDRQQFESQIEKRDAAHAEECARLRQTTEMAENRSQALATQMQALQEQVSAWTSRFHQESRSAAESLEIARSQHAADLEVLHEKLRHQAQSEEGYAATCRKLEIQLQQRDAAHAAELDQFRQSSHAATVRKQELDAQLKSLRDEVTSLKDCLASEAQAGMNSLEVARSRHAMEVESLQAEFQQRRLQDAAEREARRTALEEQFRRRIVGRDEKLTEALDRIRTLENRLQREAVGRRKAEAALAREAARPDCEPELRATFAQIDAERRIQNLTHQLESARKHEQGLRRKATLRIYHAQREIRRLKNQLAGDTSGPRKAA